MESQISPDKAIQYLIDTAPLYAQAKAERLYLEDFRNIYKADFETVFQEEDDDIRFVLKAIKN